MEFVRDKDQFSFTGIDKVARNILDLQLIVKELTEKGVVLTATDQHISNKDATSKCFLDMLGVFAEWETNLREEFLMNQFLSLSPLLVNSRLIAHKFCTKNLIYLSDSLGLKVFRYFFKFFSFL